ncbi:C2H2 transcription factor protein [Rutstroemia sp. NJR-2017a BBW]|nr:C2H2 transcription factor protein [Rutstroemia sp. NJR-2017a BBW]
MLTPLAPTSVRRAPRVQCTHLGCTKTFTRDNDRLRHEGSAHRNNHGQYLCPIVGCRKSRGQGYSRPDKVTEHLWKMHADLGYTKKA